MAENKIPRSFGTHDGTFHADEVTACALLLLFDLIDKDKVFRTRDPEILDQCEYVCDVGGYYEPENKLFDHHQAQYQGPLSSAGMILLHLKETGMMQEKEYHHFNNSLIIGVDAHDNGQDPQIPGLCTYSHIISNFTPIVYDPPEEVQNEAFNEALTFVLNHLRRFKDRYQYIQSCRDIVKKSMEQHTDCLMFEKRIPWLQLFFELDGIHHPARFVIMPSREHWTLRGVPPSYEKRMKVRLPLPSNWAGLLDEEFKNVSGIPGAIFCHKGRFISVWETKEDALKALEFTLNQAKEPS